ncbi:integrase [Pseudomonas capeferrum]
MPDQFRAPEPLFGTPESMTWQEDYYFRTYPSVRSYLYEFPGQVEAPRDFRSARYFLSMHSKSQGTFGNYRGFIERLLLWSWIYLEKSAMRLNCQEFSQFITFCEEPSSDWVGDVPRARFLATDELWSVNPDWRPMHERLQSRSWSSEAEYETDKSIRLTSTLRQLRSICSSFYNFLHREGLALANPVVAARHSDARGVSADHPTRLVIGLELVNLILRHLELNATRHPEGERALFIVATALYLYLRPSDLAKTRGAYPTMDDFHFDGTRWWLVLEARVPPIKVPVDSDFLEYLSRYRSSRGLSPLPILGEAEPLLETTNGRPGLSHRRIKEIVQAAMSEVVQKLRAEGHDGADLAALSAVSLRWLRNSGAKQKSQDKSPSTLQKQLGSVSLAYVYGRYYRE